MFFKKYRRKQISELRPITEKDILSFEQNQCIRYSTENASLTVSISPTDLLNGSPKIGDMIARNPKNHSDQWLVAQQYFKDNFEDVD
jgi:hypothetical protein